MACIVIIMIVPTVVSVDGTYVLLIDNHVMHG